MASPAIDFSKFKKKKSTPSTAQEQPKKKFTSEAASSINLNDLRPYAAAFIRGIGAFAPGGIPGAVVGGITELGAQTLEDKPYNLAQVGAQSALGAIPFGKAGNIFRNVMKGAAMGGGGAALTQQAEQGLHIPTIEDVEGITLGTGIGGIGGGLVSKLDLSKFRPKKSITPAIHAEKEIASAVRQAKELPQIKAAPTTTKAGAERIRTSDPSIGRDIMAQIESAKPPTVEIPDKPLTGGEKIVDTLNATKALASSLDVSAPMRQGIFFAGRKAWWQAWSPMIKSLRRAGYDEANKAISNHPRFGEALENGIQFTQADRIGKGEEAFASRLAQKFPGVKASEQAYSTFLNSLRMNLYADLADKAERLKVPVNKEQLASYINSGSGRGAMSLTIGGKEHASKTLEMAAPFLNTTFFSPRFIASRIQLLNPLTYAKLDPFTRKEALRDLATLTGVASSALTLAKLSGAEVTMDPTSSDFGKIKSGNVRVDLLGGFGQYIRLYSQIIKGLMPDEEGPDLKRFVESKLSPTARMALEFTSGKDYFGRDISIPKSALQNTMPMLTRDIWELAQEDPDLASLAGLTGLSAIGLSTQSYGETKKSSGGTKSGRPKIKMPKMK